LFSSETADGTASTLVWHALTFGTARAATTHQDALERVTPEAVCRATRRWLDPSSVTVGFLDPDAAPDAVTAALRPRPRRAHTADTPVLFTHDNGARVLIRPDDRPIVAVHALTLGGDLRMNERRAGMGTAWSRAVLAGAGALDAQGLGERLDELAAQLDAFSGRHSLGISATAPAREVLELVDLLGDVVVDPHMGAEDFADVRDEMLDDLRTRNDRPSQLASETLRMLRWRGHPWRLPAGGTPASVNRLTTRGVRAWHEQHFRGPQLVVSIAGGVDPDEVHEALSWLDELPAEASQAPAVPEARPMFGATRQLTAGHEQAVVRVAGAGPALGEPADLHLHLAAAILDGQGGRLFLKLREDAGLVYDVWARQIPGQYGSTFSLGLECAPARCDEAADALHTHLHALASTPPSRDELRRAQNMLIGRRALDGQRASALALEEATRLLLGTPLPRKAQAEAIRAVTSEQVSNAVARVLERGLFDVRTTP
jgi:zinc protease